MPARSPFPQPGDMSPTDKAIYLAKCTVATLQAEREGMGFQRYL